MCRNAMFFNVYSQNLLILVNMKVVFVFKLTYW